MKFSAILATLTLTISGSCDRTNREPLTYAPVPAGTYVIPKNASITTLLDFIKSRDDLSILASLLPSVAGFSQAFDTPTQWQYTFFAPSNTAFNNTGAYFTTYAATPKGKRWLGNLLQHHYVPNTAIKSSIFTTAETRIQTGNFLYVSTQVVGGSLMLNGVSKVTSADNAVTNGLVHVIDHILDPSAQIFEPEFPKSSQGFIAGSCSNPALPYC